MQPRDSYLDLFRAPYVLYGVKYIDRRIPWRIKNEKREQREAERRKRAEDALKAREQEKVQREQEIRYLYAIHVLLLPLVWLFPLRKGSMGAAWRGSRRSGKANSSCCPPAFLYYPCPKRERPY